MDWIQLAHDREKGASSIKNGDEHLSYKIFCSMESVCLNIFHLCPPPAKNEMKSVEEVKERRKYNICLLNVKCILLLRSQRDRK